MAVEDRRPRRRGGCLEAVQHQTVAVVVDVDGGGDDEDENGNSDKEGDVHDDDNAFGMVIRVKKRRRRLKSDDAPDNCKWRQLPMSAVAASDSVSAYYTVRQMLPMKQLLLSYSSKSCTRRHHSDTGDHSDDTSTSRALLLFAERGRLNTGNTCRRMEQYYYRLLVTAVDGGGDGEGGDLLSWPFPVAVFQQLHQAMRKRRRRRRSRSCHPRPHLRQ